MRALTHEGMTHTPPYYQVQANEGPAFLEAIAAFIEEQKTGKQQQPPRVSYKDAGVDIDAGNALVERIKPACKSTKRPGCDSDLGGFGGLFDLSAAGYSDGKDTVLVGATDGVGTKLKVTSRSMYFVSCRDLLVSFLHGIFAFPILSFHLRCFIVPHPLDMCVYCSRICCSVSGFLC